MNTPTDTVNERLRELRGELSIVQFAKLLGVHFNTISNYEKGRKPELAFLIRACELLHCDLDWLVFGKRVKVDIATGDALTGSVRAVGSRPAIDNADLPLLVEVVRMADQRQGKNASTMPNDRLSETVTRGFWGLKLCGASGANLPATKTTQLFLDAAERVALETAAERK